MFYKRVNKKMKKNTNYNYFFYLNKEGISNKRMICGALDTCYSPKDKDDDDIYMSMK